MSAIFNSLANDSYTDWFYRLGSLFTDPVCKTHELFRRFYLVDHEHSELDCILRVAQKIFIGMQAIAYGSISPVTSAIGAVSRKTAMFLQDVPFQHLQSQAETKTLPENREFSLLSWNVCFVGGGYPISDGGVSSWPSRIDGAAQYILRKNADVVCLYETFDAKATFMLRQKLSTTYSHIYYFIGPRAIGPCSGIFVASKYEITDPQFTPFPVDMLVGRAQQSSKGAFQFSLASRRVNFARIVATHLQHSEEPGFPIPEETAARYAEVRLILANIDTANQQEQLATVLTGDLNCNDEEYETLGLSDRFTKGNDFRGFTWGGDQFCVEQIVGGGKRATDPCNLDHTALLNGSNCTVHTTSDEVGYDRTRYNPEALSDHRPLMSTFVPTN